ncbi:MAG: hypothetical protein V4546_13520 [Bacteroidota bacterium]
MFKFIANVKERNRIRYLSNELYSHFEIMPPSIFDKDNYKKYQDLSIHWENCLQELILISFNNIHNRKIIDYFKKDKNDLKNIYEKIINKNTALKIKGRYVAAYSIVNPNTLWILLYHYKQNEFEIESQSSILSLEIITDSLLQFFLKQYNSNASQNITEFIKKYNL